MRWESAVPWYMVWCVHAACNAMTWFLRVSFLRLRACLFRAKGSPPSQSQSRAQPEPDAGGVQDDTCRNSIPSLCWLDPAHLFSCLINLSCLFSVDKVLIDPRCQCKRGSKTERDEQSCDIGAGKDTRQNSSSVATVVDNVRPMSHGLIEQCRRHGECHRPEGKLGQHIRHSSGNALLLHIGHAQRVSAALTAEAKQAHLTTLRL